MFVPSARSRAPRAYAVYIALLCIGAQAQTAHADEPASAEVEPRPPPAYFQAIDLAVDEHERGHFEEAREHYREAHEIYPNARSVRGLGKVEFELRNYGEAVRYLNDALRSQVRPLDATLRDEVTRLLDRARAYVGEVHVDVQPGTASVSIDGVTVQQVAPDSSIALLVGDHVLDFRASGRLPERRQISVRGRDRIDVHVTLAMPESSAPERHQALAERPGPVPLYKKWWTWTLVGVVAAGAATAVALSVRDRDHKSSRSYGGDWVVPNP